VSLPQLPSCALVAADMFQTAATVGDYFRCPPELVTFLAPKHRSPDAGYFAFADAVLYGRCARIAPAAAPVGCLRDTFAAVDYLFDGVLLPFDIDEVVTDLRLERYYQPRDSYVEHMTTADAVKHLYYFVRPALPVSVRRQLQRVRLNGRAEVAFPRWPLDTSVDSLMRTALGALIRHSGQDEIPFIWFWPEGAPGCVVVTHDVEGGVGRSFCGALMDLDDAHGIKSAFQIIPEMRGGCPRALADKVRSRGFEVNLHDLNHDGFLFHDRGRFLERAAAINHYAHEFQCRGFRSGAMYRRQDWFDAFEFSYDMSVPNVAHLEPQGGGCCTVMPYFVGKILELPLTTTQDYSLFHIIGEYSTRLWKQQIDLILASHGLVSFITHPDYLVEKRARTVYLDLLSHLETLRNDRGVWMALPADVDDWWRNRSQMRLARSGEGWRVEGPGAERARVACASLDGDRVVYTTI
jgi:hypothetical protein